MDDIVSNNHLQQEASPEGAPKMTMVTRRQSGQLKPRVMHTPTSPASSIVSISKQPAPIQGYELQQEQQMVSVTEPPLHDADMSSAGEHKRPVMHTVVPPLLLDKLQKHLPQQFFEVSRADDNFDGNNVQSAVPSVSAVVDDVVDQKLPASTGVTNVRCSPQEAEVARAPTSKCSTKEESQAPTTVEKVPKIEETSDGKGSKKRPEWLLKRIQRRKRYAHLSNANKATKRHRFQAEFSGMTLPPGPLLCKEVREEEAPSDSPFFVAKLSCDMCKQIVSGSREDLMSHLKACHAKKNGGNDEDCPTTWMCEICERFIFTNFGDALAHEAICKASGGDERKSVVQPLDSTAYSLSGAVCRGVEPVKSTNDKVDGNGNYREDDNKENAAPKTPPLSTWMHLPPHDLERLSAHNIALTKSIEFFQVSREDIVNNGRSKKFRDEIVEGQIGLRCITCANEKGNIRAAYCFPGSIRSMASGMATISRRHFSADKCTTIDPDLLDELKQTKAASKAETALKGKYGLETFCKDISRLYGLVESSGGIFFRTRTKSSVFTQNKPQQKFRDWNKNRDIAEPFVPSSTKFFWECKNCAVLPYQWRSSCSVVFSYGPPTRHDIEKHQLVCKGGTAPKEPRLEHLVEAAPGAERALDDIVGSKCTLVLDEDKKMVPEYVYYTMQQIVSCRLESQSGGGRADFPVGFPGLACRFCFDPEKNSGRQFFYSSSYKLWNSFGNIASHVMECKGCPQNIRVTLEALKLQRNKTRTTTRGGSQKMFMERVWKRLHGSDSAVETKKKTSSVVKSKKSVSEHDTDIDGYSYASDEETEEAKMSKKHLLDEKGRVVLVLPEDKPFATDYVYLSMQQMLPCQLDSSDHGRRNLFPVGFGGLECRFCAPYPNSRKFYYRTIDVLAGNFAQIPNHLVACKYITADVKKEIEETKKLHQQQKNKFQHGSQRDFLTRVW
eukprot:CAMPEP_0116025116 /NCGR_PEP_ID=MMETSP0321-20121206/12807_1 /TAXON_ID=163516 /ORGANISM="Leptocylindrus danicus var. danicus, Strain B650" /LENGTH=951 /DNA_ID=CAMNT_0003497149 /DNA_START=550 /DNA_END=3402 /DNA_ORIENTATION=+